MRKIIITEDEKQDILSKYTETDDKLLIYLRRNYPPREVPEEHQMFLGKYTFYVDDKSIPLKNNFGRLVDKINFEIPEKFNELSKQQRKQTIRKYLKFFEI